MTYDNSYHQPVLKTELMEHFCLTNNSFVIDGTVGFGGHANAILNDYPDIHYIGFDRDEAAVNYATKRCQSFQNFKIIQQPFSTMVDYINKHHLTPTHILLDLGVSSYQIDHSNRGFTFQKEEVLDMRMDQSTQLTAHHILNEYSKDTLATIFYTNSDVRNSHQIADSIVSARSLSSLTTTTDFANCIKKAGRYKSRSHYISVLTRCFQAIRVEVNQEMHELTTTLNQLLNCSMPLVLAIITFQPNEDRFVKSFIKQHNLSQASKKPFRLSYHQCKGNPRAKSALLRIIHLPGN